jgi:hypothetical protein
MTTTTHYGPIDAGDALTRAIGEVIDAAKKRKMQCPLELTITDANGDEATAWLHSGGRVTFCSDFERPVVLPVTIAIGNEYGAVRCKLIAEPTGTVQ